MCTLVHVYMCTETNTYKQCWLLCYLNTSNLPQIDNISQPPDSDLYLHVRSCLASLHIPLAHWQRHGCTCLYTVGLQRTKQARQIDILFTCGTQDADSMYEDAALTPCIHIVVSTQLI